MCFFLLVRRSVESLADYWTVRILFDECRSTRLIGRNESVIKQQEIKETDIFEAAVSAHPLLPTIHVEYSIIRTINLIASCERGGYQIKEKNILTIDQDENLNSAI